MAKLLYDDEERGGVSLGQVILGECWKYGIRSVGADHHHKHDKFMVELLTVHFVYQ